MNESSNIPVFGPDENGSIAFEILAAQFGFLCLGVGDSRPSIVANEDDMVSVLTQSIERLMPRIKDITAEDKKVRILIYAVEEGIPSANSNNDSAMNALALITELLQNKTANVIQPQRGPGSKTTFVNSPNNYNGENSVVEGDGLTTDDVDKIVEHIGKGGTVAVPASNPKKKNKFYPSNK